MIYFVRHGEAAAGWGAHPDPGLSAKGKAQAEQVCIALRQNAIATILTSPMMRCQETAAPFAAASGLVAAIEPRVTEIPTPADVADRVTWLRDLMAGSWHAAPQMIQDWRQTLIDTVSAMPANTVVFSHFVAINALVGHAEGRDEVTVFRPDNCSITVFSPSETGLRLVSRGNEAGTKVLYFQFT